MDFLKVDGQSILIDCFAFELYLDVEYLNRGLIRVGSGDYKILGVGSFRIFNSEKDLERRHDLPVHTLGMPLTFTTVPTDHEIMDISRPKGAPFEPTIVLRYFKGDKFVVNKSAIKSSDNAEAVWNLVEDGKLESLPYLHIPEILAEVTPKMNDTRNSVSIATIHAVVAERYRDPDDPSKEVRHMKVIPSYVRAINPREGAAMSTTFGMIAFEDINTALLTANNRAKSGKKEPITQLEKVLRGNR